MTDKPHQDHDTLDTEEIAEGVKDLFGADGRENQPILQPDAPPSAEDED